MSFAIGFPIFNIIWHRCLRLGMSARLLWALFSVGLLLASASTRAQDVQVVVHAEVPVQSISLAELRAIYSMRLQRWSDGVAIQVYVLPQQNSLHQRFCKSLLQALPHQLQAVWYRLVYSGMGRAPIEVADEEELIQRVSSTPGAIGYVESGAGGNSSLRRIDVLR